MARKLCQAAFVCLGVALVYQTGAWLCQEPFVPVRLRAQEAEVSPSEAPGQLAAAVDNKSRGCVVCHRGAHDPHARASVQLGCVDCHGGDATASDKHKAHVAPRFPNVFHSSANPVRSYTVLNHERPEFIRFVNPGDLRVAHLSCGTAGCHPQETLAVKKSMMTHGCMLWGAALYNNGAVPNKWPSYGESYSMHGTPQRLQTIPAPTPQETAEKGILPYLEPLPRFQVSQPGNILRIFEPGGRFIPDIGIPERLEEPGKPRTRLSNRGLGTANRTDPVFIGLQKTRLLDPTLNFMGTNDHPGDYRSSGCTSCHMVYANDRSRVHSGPYARFGNRGFAANTTDPTIPRSESGHPIQHRFTSAIPTSQCIVCHVHPGTNVMNSYLGFMWWDLETHAELMYREAGHRPSREDVVQAQMSNPEGSSIRGKWSDPDFLANVASLNPQMRHTQFADFNGHGWVFSAVFKKNREGIPLDHFGDPVPDPTPQDRMRGIKKSEHVTDLYRDRDWNDAAVRAEVARAEEELEQAHRGTPVHQLDVHLEKGMHCVDCHFRNDVHGNTKLYGEVRAAIEITCRDCHGSMYRRATGKLGASGQMRTSGPAAAVDQRGHTIGLNLTDLRTPFGKPRFEVYPDRIIQNSMVERDLSWEVSQVVDVIDPTNKEKYNPLAAIAKTVKRLDGDQALRLTSAGIPQLEWGAVPEPHECAHANGRMSCIACHSSWNPSCFGCHLPQEADRKMPGLHNAGDVTKNYTSYNFQTLRDDVFMLARDGNVTGNRINPSRSSCAIHVTSYNVNRESVYVQQQTVSAEGLSGIAFSTNVPHTVRGKQETKSCSDCHLSAEDDNNAIMAQLLMQGTNYVNFIGKFCWIATGEHGVAAVQVTENKEPQAVIGSFLHSQAFPEKYQAHQEHHGELQTAYEHPGRDIGDALRHPLRKPEILALQARGEYLYAACGTGGVRLFDIAFIDHKGFSERIVTAPASPLGQRFYVDSPYATDVTAPTTIAPDPTRNPQRIDRPENDEPVIDGIYAYVYATDLQLGLIVVGAGTVLDGNPTNNFLEPALVYNPDGVLNGARSITIVGEYAYICCEAGLVTVDLADPLQPRITNVMEHELHHPHDVQFQFRYGFVVDDDGLKVLDCTDLAKPKLLEHGSLSLPGEAHSLYVARTYAYVAAGSAGLLIVDVKNPTRPRLDQVYDADGCINDLHDVKLGITYASEFAYLADGHNGLRVVQLTSPETPGSRGFSPRPTPQLVATFEIPKHGHALAIAEGIDRDRAVDESGNQIAVFGRVGAGPLPRQIQERMYLYQGLPWKVGESRRDHRIPDLRRREVDLHLRLERMYGPSRHPALKLRSAQSTNK